MPLIMIFICRKYQIMPIKHLSLIILSCSFLVAACSSGQQARITPSVVSLKVLQGATEEANVRNHLQVVLDHPQEIDTHIYFNLKGTAKETNQTRFGVPDYHLLTPSPLVIPAGETSNLITYEILQDSLHETEEHFTLKIAGVGSGNAILYHVPSQLVYTHYIFEKDKKAFPDQDGDLIKMDIQIVQFPCKTSDKLN